MKRLRGCILLSYSDILDHDYRAGAKLMPAFFIADVLSTSCIAPCPTFRVSEKNKCAGLRRILVRMQGASASAY